MKGETTLKILEVIEDVAGGIFDVFDVILNSGYGASFSKLNYEFSKRQKERLKIKADKEYQKEMRAKFNSLLYKLERDGLIEKKKDERKKLIVGLTPKGKARLLLLKTRRAKSLPATLYKKFDADKFIIVIFDIPEKERRKRNWLRLALKSLELKMIQKSVWMGKVKLPKTFLEDLKRLRLVDFVEIFEISKTGSLKQIS
jgi:CRISPR/Cas system-associated endoribonuclease Cas2